MKKINVEIPLDEALEVCATMKGTQKLVEKLLNMDGYESKAAAATMSNIHDRVEKAIVDQATLKEIKNITNRGQ